MTDTVILLKIQSIERCLKRIHDKYNAEKLEDDFDMQDIIILNLQRACELSIDIAQRVLKKKKLGLSNESAAAFFMLADNDIISKELSLKMSKMVGFRNIAVHDYTNLNLGIIKNIIKYGINDIQEYTSVMIRLAF